MICFIQPQFLKLQVIATVCCLCTAQTAKRVGRLVSMHLGILYCFTNVLIITSIGVVTHCRQIQRNSAFLFSSLQSLPHVGRLPGQDQFSTTSFPNARLWSRVAFPNTVQYFFSGVQPLPFLIFRFPNSQVGCHGWFPGHCHLQNVDYPVFFQRPLFTKTPVLSNKTSFTKLPIYIHGCLFILLPPDHLHSLFYFSHQDI